MLPNIPNINQNSLVDYYTNPKVLKLKDNGINLCCWFIHHSIVTDLLKELNPEFEGTKYNIQKLKEIYNKNENIDFYKDDYTKDYENRKITKLGKDFNNYLTDLSSLNSTHVTMLKELKNKILEYLFKIYGVTIVNQFNIFL